MNWTVNNILQKTLTQTLNVCRCLVWI